MRGYLDYGYLSGAALVALALVAIVAHLHSETGMRGIEGYGPAIEMQARQRLLTERVLRLALELKTAPAAERPALRETVDLVAGQIAATQEELVGTAVESTIQPHVSESVRQVYRRMPESLPERLRNFALAAELLVNAGQPEQSAFDQLRRDHSEIVSLVNEAVLALETVELQRLKRVEFWNLFYLALTLLVLVLLAVFLFRPLNRRIASEQQLLERSNLELEQNVEARTRELAGSEAKLRAIIDTSIDGIVTMDLHGNIMSFNPAAERMFGYSAEEVIGTNMVMLMPEADREEQATILHRQMQLAGNQQYHEFTGERLDGSTFAVEIAFVEQSGARKRLFTAILRDVTERRRIEQMKNEFISLVSHELRTPLTSIRGSLGLLAGGALGQFPDKVKSLIDIAANNSERLVRLVNDILDIEKIEAGKMRFDLRPLPVMQLVDSAVEDNQVYATRSGVRIRITAALADARVRGDKDRLRQVLDNLLSNAVKYSPAGETVEVQVTRREGFVRVAVQDKGPGIPDSFHAKIFEKFSQADSSTTRQRGGTGLGLNISKAIVERHNGFIAFDTVVGEGTTFFFDLPELEVAAVTEVTRARDQRDAVLIVEDEPDVARLLALLLEKEGITSDIASDAASARQLLSKHTYRALTLDLMLPDEDGVHLLRELRRDEATRELPIIVVSAVADQGRDQLNGSGIGVIDWLAKPIDEQRLLDAIRRSLGAGTGRMPRILHVEDDEDIFRTVSSIVEGYATVHNAVDLAQARRSLASSEFDLVILDVMLPDGSGLDLLTEINNVDKPPQVIVFSARDVDENVSERVAAALVKARTSNQQLVDKVRAALRTTAAARPDD